MLDTQVLMYCIHQLKVNFWISIGSSVYVCACVREIIVCGT